MASAGLPIHTPTGFMLCLCTSATQRSSLFSSSPATSRNLSIKCKATTSSSSSSITDFDLYDLLGIDSSSNQSQIKTAYRSLQKRCHPDIAGPAGHDMAIILNEVYSVLSDPQSRLAYDKEVAKSAELQGYTGKPIYSAWFGLENEQRALFVDEVKCIGCLKCALFAERTFAIESAYGRARVVAQWADPEDKVQAAIDACPVDCISIVERSDLAALEFLMSKQPRGNVRVGRGNAVGARVSNIFADAKKFQTQFQGAMDKASTRRAKETHQHTEARISAIQAIRSISSWLHWQAAKTGNSTAESCSHLTHVQGKSSQPDINKIREAAKAKKQARAQMRHTSRIQSNYINGEEYWNPLALALPVTTQSNFSSSVASQSPSSAKRKGKNDERRVRNNNKTQSPWAWGIPVGMATIAATIVQLQVREGTVDRLKEHVGGSVALEIVNSSLLQVMLAGLTWYLIGATVLGLVEAFLRSNTCSKKK